MKGRDAKSRVSSGSTAHTERPRRPIETASGAREPRRRKKRRFEAVRGCSAAVRHREIERAHPSEAGCDRGLGWHFRWCAQSSATARATLLPTSHTHIRCYITQRPPTDATRCSSNTVARVPHCEQARRSTHRASRGSAQCSSCRTIASCRGFARLWCKSCGDSRLVAFACKGRGFCPSCLGRRMCATAAGLVEHVLPEADLQQWVLRTPRRVRLCEHCSTRRVSSTATTTRR